VNTRDLIRTSVLKTNPYWPFSRLNKIPYILAIRVFTRVCRRFPEITSVYLRHPLVEGNWTPGLSDIDLGIIIDSKLTSDEEFSFLHSFWKEFKTMKKFFPMAGEIEILNDDQIESWLKFGLEGYNARNWVLLHGGEAINRECAVNPQKVAIDSLHTAIRFYLGYFQDKLNQNQGSQYLVLRDLKRITSKILRCLNYPDVGQSGNQIPVERLEDKTDMIGCTLKELEEGITNVLPLNNEASSANNDQEWLADISSHNRVFFEHQAFDIGEIASCHEAIQSIMLNLHKTIFIVVKDGLNPSAMKHCINGIRRVFARADRMPVIVSESIFNYMLRYYNPFQYTDFVSYRTVVHGKDLLAEIPPPVESSFIHCLMSQTSSSLTFPRRRALIVSPESNGLTHRHLLWALERSLFLKLYLEQGIAEPWYRARIAQCEKYYPTYYQKLEELERDIDGDRTGFDNRKWFKLFRDIADDIHQSVSTSNIVDPPLPQ